MNIQNHIDLAKLEFVAYDLNIMDAFANLYEELLRECQETDNTEMARALQHILLKQLEFMTNVWLQGERELFNESVMRNVQ